MNSPTTIERFQRWFESMTDGDWHHTYGLSIANIDNPGWSLRVDLVDTYLIDRRFDDMHFQREDENDWIICKAGDGVFQSFGGPQNLDEMLRVFLDWAEADTA